MRYRSLTLVLIVAAVIVSLALPSLGEEPDVGSFHCAGSECSLETALEPQLQLVRGSPQDAAGAEGQAPNPTPPGNVAHAAFFYSPSCPHCKVVEEEVFPPLQSKYGPQLEIQAFNVRDRADYEVFLDLEARHGADIPEVPVIFMGEAVMVGEDVIRDRLEGQIEACLQAGGCPPPTQASSPGMTPTPESAESGAIGEELAPGVTAYTGTGAEGANRPVVTMAYFLDQGCQECGRAWFDLRHLLGKYANVYLRAYDIATPENKVLNEALSEHYGVPERQRLSTPALFIGDQYLLGEEITLAQIEAAYRLHSVRGSSVPWELVADRIRQAEGHILDRFRSFGLYTVVAAGLIDGLNPCAFATIVFFVSYLAISGRRGRDILIVGAAFTTGVFLAYLLVGVGLWRVLQTLGFLTSLGRWVYLITGLLCLFLACLSILDYRKARQGRLEEMTLSLPHALRMRINSIIRQTRGARAYVWVAFIAGLSVSIIELACTGQVYLPTIIFVMGVPELRVRAFLYLLLYNLMFILPLVVIFVLAYRGTTSRQLTGFLQARASAVKLAMSVLFFALAGWLLYAVFVA